MRVSTVKMWNEINRIYRQSKLTNFKDLFYGVRQLRLVWTPHYRLLNQIILFTSHRGLFSSWKADINYIKITNDWVQAVITADKSVYCVICVCTFAFVQYDVHFFYKYIFNIEYLCSCHGRHFTKRFYKTDMRCNVDNAFYMHYLLCYQRSTEHWLMLHKMFKSQRHCLFPTASNEYLTTAFSMCTKYFY